MIIFMPTCDTHTRAAETSAKLLAKHWPGHPPLHVSHHARRPTIDLAAFHHVGEMASISWSEGAAKAVRAIGSDLFLLLLDDYGLHRQPDVGFISRAESLMESDRSAGMFQLVPHGSGEIVSHGIERKTEPILLLQAAIWRSEFFLSIVDRVGAVSPWDFEIAASRANLAQPVTVYGIPADGEWPIRYHNLTHQSRWQCEHVTFLRAEGVEVDDAHCGQRGAPGQPRNPLSDIPLPGDVVEAIAKRIGADRLARLWEKWTGVPCGCAERKEKMNAAARRLARWLGYDWKPS